MKKEYLNALLFWLALMTCGLSAVISSSSSTYASTACTHCGFAPTSELPCCDDCFHNDGDMCVASCGFACQTDDDCGKAGPRGSPCSACINNACSGLAAFDMCQQQNAWNSSGPQAPILPSAWNASVLFWDNINNTLVGKGWTAYDDRFGGLLLEFSTCPFDELGFGLDMYNDGPCSVVFYKGLNMYVYPEASICCGYEFPVWHPDAYRVGNASFGGVFDVNGQQADYWRFEYTCPWLRTPLNPDPSRLPAYTVQRDIYLLHGTNLPLRMNETLIAGHSDFYNLQVGLQDESLFSQYYNTCITRSNNASFLQYCNQYNSQTPIGYLGYG